MSNESEAGLRPDPRDERIANLELCLLDFLCGHGPPPNCAGKGECVCDDAWPLFGLPHGAVDLARRKYRALVFASGQARGSATNKDPSCIRTYLAAAEERGRRRGVEEANDLRELLREARAYLNIRKAKGKITEHEANFLMRLDPDALAPRDSGKVKP